jgi:hypothetical protein
MTSMALEVNPTYQGQHGDDGGENAIDPDLLGIAGFFVADVAPVDIAQQDGPAGADVWRRRGVNGRYGAHEHDAQH